jgi:hypothetical protein
LANRIVLGCSRAPPSADRSHRRANRAPRRRAASGTRAVKKATGRRGFHSGKQRNRFKAIDPMNDGVALLRPGAVAHELVVGSRPVVSRASRRAVSVAPLRLHPDVSSGPASGRRSKASAGHAAAAPFAAVSVPGPLLAVPAHGSWPSKHQAAAKPAASAAAGGSTAAPAPGCDRNPAVAEGAGWILVARRAAAPARLGDQVDEDRTRVSSLWRRSNMGPSFRSSRTPGRMTRPLVPARRPSTVTPRSSRRSSSAWL